MMGASTGVAAAEGGEYGDLSGQAWQILAPGAEGGLIPGEYSFDQAAIYNSLTPHEGRVTEKSLSKYYLSEKFGVPAGSHQEFTSRAGLEIWRDSHDIPHIIGATRADAMFGSGWVAAQDRGLLLKLGIGPAYAAALGIPGVNPFGLLLEARSFTPSAYAVNWVGEQKKSLEEMGPQGERVIGDLENWAEGINAYEETLPESQRLPHFGLSQAIAGFAFIGSIFGNGGGQEVSNSEFLSRLEKVHGKQAGEEIYRDLRQSNDPEAPTTGHTEFPYDQEPSKSEGLVGPGSGLVEPEPASNPVRNATNVLKASRRRASNFLLVGASRTANGHPKAVMGPQLGYFYPEIVFQADMHAPGLDAQGVVAPISPYVFIGRGKDFAWSLTSEGAENTQQFLEKLCNPEEGGEVTRSTDSYEYKGACVPFSEIDAGTIGAGNGEPEHEVYFKESVHGPISGTVKVGGKLYAVATDRADRGREPQGEVAFSELDSNEVHNPQEFFNAANNLETTFNMAYVDSKHIAFFSTGLLPKTAAGTNPSLPTFGTGAYDWKGWLSENEHPHEVDPASGLLLNWNNKPAPGWAAASTEWGYGPLQRVKMYTGFPSSGAKLYNDVSVMNKAATEDFRARFVWPEITKVLETGPAPSKLAEEAVNEVTAWSASGQSLLGQKYPKAPAAAVIEKVFSPIAETVMKPVLGEQLGEAVGISGGTDNGPNSGGSSFGGGWYGYVYKDLKDLLGESVAQPYSQKYCGNGSLAACRESLWSVIQQGVEELSAAQGPNVSAWKAAPVRITFPPLPFVKTTMRWTNRSTFQQAIEFTGHGAEE